MNRCGFVHMETADMAANAIKALNNTQFKGINIVVEAGRLKDRQAGNKVGSVNSRRSGDRRGNDGDRSNQNFNQGGPMRRDRNMQQNRSNAPYPNRYSDGQGGGNRFGNGEFG